MDTTKSTNEKDLMDRLREQDKFARKIVNDFRLGDRFNVGILKNVLAVRYRLENDDAVQMAKEFLRNGVECGALNIQNGICEVQSANRARSYRKSKVRAILSSLKVGPQQGPSDNATSQPNPVTTKPKRVSHSALKPNPVSSGSMTSEMQGPVTRARAKAAAAATADVQSTGTSSTRPKRTI